MYVRTRNLTRRDCARRAQLLTLFRFAHLVDFCSRTFWATVGSAPESPAGGVPTRSSPAGSGDPVVSTQVPSDCSASEHSGFSADETQDAPVRASSACSTPEYSGSDTTNADDDRCIAAPARVVDSYEESSGLVRVMRCDAGSGGEDDCLPQRCGLLDADRPLPDAFETSHDYRKKTTLDSLRAIARARRLQSCRTGSGTTQQRLTMGDAPECIVLWDDDSALIVDERCAWSGAGLGPVGSASKYVPLWCAKSALSHLAKKIRHLGPTGEELGVPPGSS